MLVNYMNKGEFNLTKLQVIYKNAFSHLLYSGRELLL